MNTIHIFHSYGFDLCIINKYFGLYLYGVCILMCRFIIAIRKVYETEKALLSILLVQDIAERKLRNISNYLLQYNINIRIGYDSG